MLWAWWPGASAQTELPVQVIGTSEGLSQSSVLSLHQDPYGFVWLGTRDGLNLCEGNKIRVFKNVPGDTLSLAGNHINDIADAADGNLWIAHNMGLSLYDRTRNRFKNYRVEDDNPEIRAITVEKNGILASGWSGVYELNPEKGLLEKTEKLGPTGQSSVTKIARAPDGTLWIATTNRGLVRFKNTRLPVSELEKSLRVEDILFHSNGKVYLATRMEGIFEYSTGGQLLRQWSKTSSSQTRLEHTRALMEDRNGRIWIARFQGLAVLDPKDAKLTEIDRINGMSHLSIRSLMLDRNGSLWIGTFHNGAFLYDPYLGRFRTTALPETEKKERAGIVSSLAKLSQGELYVGTENGALFLYNSDRQVKSAWNLRALFGKPVVIKSLLYQAPVLWIGTLRDGLFKLRDGRITPVLLPPHQNWEEIGVINQLSANGAGLWLMGDKGGGLHYFDGTQLAHFPGQEEIRKAIDKGSAKNILPLTAGTFLVSTHGSGLLHFSGTGVKSLLPDIKNVNHVARAGDTLLVSTQNHGLYVLDKNFKTLKYFDTRHGILNNTVLQSFATPENGTWLITYSGISHFIKENLRNYHYNNGLPLAEINAAGTDPLVLGGKNTWVSFSPGNLYPNPHNTPVYLTDVKVNNLTRHSFGELLHLKELPLKYNESTLTFEFAGLNYIMPKNNTYRYKMEGLDPQWRYADSRGIAEYSQVPPGKYNFLLQAANNDGIWSKNTYSFKIRIKPPFWQTWPAYLLYALGIAAGILLVRYNALQSARLQLQETQLEKAGLAQQLKAKYFTDISHEIRTPLTLILSPLEELLEEANLSGEDKKKIRAMQYHGKSLLLLVNQLLEINSLEDKKEKINASAVDVARFIAQIRESFQSLANKQSIHWVTGCTAEHRECLLLDKDKIEKVILNLLSNAFKYTQAGGTVSLQVNTSKQNDGLYGLEITVKDTGTGINPGELPYIFDRFFKGKDSAAMGTGVGLALVKAIVENLYGGSIHVESEAGKGSTFRVKIPGIREVSPNGSAPPDFHLPPEYLPKEDDPFPVLTPKNKERILVVEDNKDLREYLVQKLGEHYAIVAADCAEEAKATLQEEDIDLVVSDVMLPEMSGKELCSQIKNDLTTSHIPVILLTAIQDTDFKIDSLGTGADDYLTKPFVFKELLLRIQNILRQKERFRLLFQQKNELPLKAGNRVNSRDSELLQNITGKIEANLDNPEYSIEQLGYETGLSRVHLFRKLKHLTGLSPSQFIRNYRLQKALEILSREEIRVSELAMQVGFNDTSYFIKCFREKFGVSPNEYAKNN